MVEARRLHHATKACIPGGIKVYITFLNQKKMSQLNSFTSRMPTFLYTINYVLPASFRAQKYPILKNSNPPAAIYGLVAK